MINNNLGISLADYRNGNNDGQALFDDSNVTTDELSELSKALEAGSITGRETTDLSTASGAPLKVESLENTLKVLTFKESDIQFWKRVPKLAAYNTVEEFNQLSSYGSEAGVFTNEGELPKEEDSIYTRRSEIVKFLGVTKIVSHPMQLVRTQIGSIIQQEIKNGTLFLLRKADRAMMYADSDIIPQEFNGFLSQHRKANLDYNDYMNSEVVIDLRGKTLKEADIEQGSLSVISNFGHANLLMAPPIVLSDFVKNFYESKFIQPNTSQVSAGVMGQRVQKFQSQYGEIELGYDIFLNASSPRKMNSTSTHNQAPSVPTGTSATSVADNGFTKFNDANEAGDFYYAVASKNRFGESPLMDINGGNLLAVGQGQSVDLKFTAGAGTNPATGYVVYRSKRNPQGAIGDTQLYPLFEVSTAQLAVGYDGGVANTVRDRNRFLPETNQAVLLQSDQDVYSFKQLAPLMKMDLAVLSPATRFTILMYGTPMLYAPKKMVRYVNIGRVQ